MSDRDIINAYRLELVRIAVQLRQWAVESRNGGWSTHQVELMRREADAIGEFLGVER